MQAPQRGKKRGAEKAVPPDAGGKRIKQEEGEQRPPFVCDIYRRDVASFLSREQIQQWRQTSAFSNAALSMYPHRLPRFNYDQLTVVFASADHCRVKKDGFLRQKSGNDLMTGKEFNAIFKFRFCCHDVRNRAGELVGERLFPNKPDDEGVAFQLRVLDWEEEMVVCRAPNLLTRRTAPAMLHFLHHLSHQTCYNTIRIQPGSTADAGECALNPLVLRALPKFRLRGIAFDMHSLGEPSALTAKMAAEMGIRFNQLHYDIDSGGGLPELLHCIATGRQQAKELSVLLTNQQGIDQIIKYFEEDVHSLEGAIRDVHCDYFYDWADWPTKCPREAATQVTKKCRVTTDYRFEFANVHSGEPFSMRLDTHHYNGKVEICMLHLKFGSA